LPVDERIWYSYHSEEAKWIVIIVSTPPPHGTVMSLYQPAYPEWPHCSLPYSGWPVLPEACAYLGASP